DLKPSNILLDAADDEPRITDFGLAKNLRSDTQLTLTGQTLGSPNYIPPEQIKGSATSLSSASPESRPGQTDEAADEASAAAREARALPQCKISFASDVYSL